MAAYMQVEMHTSRSYQTRYKPLEELSSDELYKNYRFTAEGIRRVTNLIKDDFVVTESGRGRPVSPETAVLITLKYLASNTYQQAIAETFKLSQSTVSRCITFTVEKLVSKASAFIRFPQTIGDKRRTQERFSQIAGFPSVVGCIDGTHVRILRPRTDESQYVCRKGYHSINVQAVCDHKGAFIHVSARWPGSTNDSFILRDSALWTAFESGDITGIILGDSAYPVRKWLMTPFRETHNDEAKIAYNTSLCKTRVLIEQAFGRLKRRWGILHQEVRMETKMVPKLIVVCMVLHNIAIDMNMPDFNFVMDEGIENNENDDVFSHYTGREDGLSYRNHIVEIYFRRN